MPIQTRTNHRRDLTFAREFGAAVGGKYDRVIGFNKLPDLDVLYCADPSVHDKKRSWWARLTPRHAAQMFLERACFGKRSRTRVLLLSQASASSYRRHWNTPVERIAVLPPVVDPSRRRGHLRTFEYRTSARQTLGLPLGATIWLWIGTKPHKKGLDRVVDALRHYPDSLLAILGVEADSAEGMRIAPHVERANVGDRVRFLGYREDVPDAMSAADLLVHPARLDVTGQVILEALINGLPVITSEVCGFAQFVNDAAAGILIREPFDKSEFERALDEMMSPSRLASYSRNGISYGLNHLRMDGLESAADIIEGRRPVASRNFG